MQSFNELFKISEIFHDIITKDQLFNIYKDNPKYFLFKNQKVQSTKEVAKVMSVLGHKISVMINI